MRLRKHEIYIAQHHLCKSKMLICGKYLLCILLWDGQSGAATKGDGGEALVNIILTGPRVRPGSCRAMLGRATWKNTRVVRMHDMGKAEPGREPLLGFRRERPSWAGETAQDWLVSIIPGSSKSKLKERFLEASIGSGENIKAEEYCLLQCGGGGVSRGTVRTGLALHWLVCLSKD